MIERFYYVEWCDKYEYYDIVRRTHIFGVLIFGGGFGPFKTEDDAWKVANFFNLDMGDYYE